jgi:hypothetical protein
VKQLANRVMISIVDKGLMAIMKVGTRQRGGRDTGDKHKKAALAKGNP